LLLCILVVYILHTNNRAYQIERQDCCSGLGGSTISIPTPSITVMHMTSLREIC
jgi:hypothetical protein